MIAVSSCLLGMACRYDGNANLNEDIKVLAKKFGVIPICPEQMGGMATPRDPSEIIQIAPLKVVSNKGENVTNAFVKGAEEALALAQDFGCDYAILKAKSPSCGSVNVYDGEFDRKLIPGAGVTTRLLRAHGIKVYNEDNYNELLELLGVLNG